MTFAKNMITMKYDSMFDPLVLLFVGASYALTLLVGAFFVKNGQVKFGYFCDLLGYAGLAFNGDWFFV